METKLMGQVLTQATIENLKDLWDAERGLRPADQVRRLTLDDALVDSGASTLALPTRLIRLWARWGRTQNGSKLFTPLRVWNPPDGN